MTRRLAVLALWSLSNCNRAAESDGHRLAQTYCSVCHEFPQPALLDKQTWRTGVLPQMALRLGAQSGSFQEQLSRDPHMAVLTKPVSQADWDKIVQFYLTAAPDSLPAQSLPAEPQLDPQFFSVAPFVRGLQSSGIITLLKADPENGRIFVGEAGSNTLRVFDWKRRLKTTLQLHSPPTDVISQAKHVLVLESGRLDPNDEPLGTLGQYDVGPDGSLTPARLLIDSLIRPVFVRAFDFDGDGRDEFVICEFGNNIGRLALYRFDGAKYQRHVLDASPGAIRFEIRDMNGDGAADIVALFAQADERIMLFTNDGKGNFSAPRVLARFPPIYGSMYFTLADFNGDGKPDIVYVNGDNFDYSRVLKPYHGVRILENDGQNNFTERYFYPIYGAAQAVVADFNKDGKPDILVSSNFADQKHHPERSIMFLENTGGFTFRPYAFTASARSQWNVMTIADLNRNGWPDVIVGAMRLSSIASIQRSPGAGSPNAPDALLVFENRMGKPNHRQ